MLNKPELAEEEAYSMPASRIEHQAELKKIIEDWSKDYTIEEAVDLILGAGVPAAPIYDIKAVMENDHIANARQMFLDCDHPVASHIKLNGNPVKLMDDMPELKWAAPELGQDNADIYGGFGVDAAQLAELKEKGVI